MDSVGALSSNMTTFTQKVGTDTIQAKLKVPVEEPVDSVQQGVQNKPEAHTMEQVVALTQALSSYSGNIKPGETLKIQVGSEEIATISKVGETNWDRMKTSVRDAGRQVVSFTSEAIENDPSFMFREAVEAVKRPLSNGAPEVIQDLAVTKGLYPGIRAGVLYLDIKKAWKTIKNPESKTMDKIIDVGHCITDLGGLVGVAAPLVGLAIPGANILAAVAIVGDIVSFGYHAIKYVLNKNDQIKKEKAKEEAAKQEANKPKPNVVKPDVVKPQDVKPEAGAGQ